MKDQLPNKHPRFSVDAQGNCTDHLNPIDPDIEREELQAKINRIFGRLYTDPWPLSSSRPNRRYPTPSDNTLDIFDDVAMGLLEDNSPTGKLQSIFNPEETIFSDEQTQAMISPRARRDNPSTSTRKPNPYPYPVAIPNPPAPND